MDKQKATAFAKHLTTIFRPFPSQLTAMEEETNLHELNVPHQTALPLQKIRIHEVENIQVRYQAEYTTLYDIHSGVPQGGILGPILYSIFTATIPETEQTLIATHADDTAILASHPNPITAPAHLQHHRNQFEQWLKRWRIQANGTK
jgi:hypothetical protein